MPMQWNPEADARLFTYLVKLHINRIDYAALAKAMGPAVTPKAISHRISKLKEKAANWEKRNPYASHLMASGPRKRKLNKGDKTGLFPGGMDDLETKPFIKSEFKSEFKTEDGFIKPEAGIFFQPGLGVPVHAAGMPLEGMGEYLGDWNGMEVVEGGDGEEGDGVDVEDIPLMKRWGVRRARMRVKTEAVGARVVGGNEMVAGGETGESVQEEAVTTKGGIEDHIRRLSSAAPALDGDAAEELRPMEVQQPVSAHEKAPILPPVSKLLGQQFEVGKHKLAPMREQE